MKNQIYIDNVTFKERSLAGYMPLGYQAGYIYENPRIEIVAHELGHGAFSLRHTFSPDQFIASEGKTQNLMDYADGTELWHHQWQEIHNPNKLLFGWAQDEEEGEMIGFSDYFRTRQMVEQIRFGYAFNKNVKIVSNKSTAIGANNIVLGDGVKYQKLLIGLNGSLPININPRACDISNNFHVLNNMDAYRFGFCIERQTNNRTFYAVEFESKIANNEFENLKTYLFCENKEEWSEHIDYLISNVSYGLINLNALSDEALKELTTQQRISLLIEISKNANRSFDGLAARVVENVPKSTIVAFFESIKHTTIFTTFRNKMNFVDYTEFVKSSVLLFYQQDFLLEKFKNIEVENMLTWHLGIGANGIGDQINYKFSVVKERLKIEAEVEKWVGHGPQGMQTAKFEGKVLLKNETYYMTDILGVYLSEGKLGKIDAVGKVIPIPVFYFDWICENQNREDRIKAIDASVTVLSLALGIGELRMVAAAGRFIFGARTIAEIMRSSVDLVLLNDKIMDKIRYETEYGGDFLVWWDRLWFIYDVAFFNLNAISQNREFFNYFVISWNSTKKILKTKLDSQSFEELQVFINEIEKNL